MGKFQLNKKGEDPLKIYEDVFKIANDTVETHLGKLGKMPNPISESKASEWESVESIASEYTSHKYDKEIQQTLDNIAKKQAEYTRECPDGCGKKFNTIDDNAVAYHLYHDHGYSSEDSRKSAGLE